MAKESARERFARVVAREGGVQPVADALGVCISHVSMIQNGKRGVSGKLAAKIQQRYRIPATLWFEAA